jgi:hypothetical protein
MAEPQWGHSLQDWMQNAGADLLYENSTLPLTLTKASGPRASCYITSPKIAWFDYAIQEVSGQFLLKISLQLLAKFASWMGLNDNTIVGNFPVSTNVWLLEQYSHILETCKLKAQSQEQRFVFVRNLLLHQHGTLIQELKSIGFVLLPARVIYEFDLRQGLQKKPSHLMRDLSALKKSSFKALQVKHIDEKEAAWLQHLYDLIYIQKHSVFNARYTSIFFLEMINSNQMSSLCLKDEHDQTIAFALLYQIGNTLTVPALGYLENDKGPGIYRLLFAAIFNYTLEKGLLLNYSSGAGDFKRKRGAQDRLEYTAVKAPPSFLNWKSKLLGFASKKAEQITSSDLIQRGA